MSPRPTTIITASQERPSLRRLLASWHAWTAAERSGLALVAALFLIGVAIRCWRAWQLERMLP